jgi:hypothetical protein
MLSGDQNTNSAVNCSRSHIVDADIDIMGAIAVPDLKQGFVLQCLKSDQCCNFSGTSDVSHHT